MSKSGGVFQIDDVTRTMSKGGGVRLVFHPSKFRPPPPTWLAGYGPGNVCNFISLNSMTRVHNLISDNYLDFMCVADILLISV